MRLIDKEQANMFFDAIQLDPSINRDFIFDIYETCVK